MTRQVTVDEVRANLTELLDAVQRGDEIEIAAEGRPLARLTAATNHAVRPRTPDLACGKIKVIGDLLAPLPKDFEDEFYR